MTVYKHVYDHISTQKKTESDGCRRLRYVRGTGGFAAAFFTLLGQGVPGHHPMCNEHQPLQPLPHILGPRS